MQSLVSAQLEATELEANKAALLEKAKKELENDTGVLVSKRMFDLLQNKGLLGEKDYLGWKIPTLKTVEHKTIYVWLWLLGDKDFILPPYAHQGDLKQ